MPNEFEKKINTFMLNDLTNKSEPIILEFGVRKGISTKNFIKVCEQKKWPFIFDRC